MIKSNYDHTVICGHSRAGTTLLHEVMRQLNESQGGCWHFYDSERTFSAAEPRHRPVVTKRPLDVFRRDQLRAYAKTTRLKVMLCVRDVRSMLTSYHASVPGDYFYHADAQYLVKPNRTASLSNPGLLAVHDALMAIHEDQDIDSQIVRYEDTLQRHYEHGSASPGMALALNGDRPMDHSRIDAWRDHRPRLRDQFDRFPRLYAVQSAYGYDVNF